MPKIRIYHSRTDKKYTEVFQRPGETLLNALRRSGYMTSYPCGGNGVCGKCRFEIMQGETVLTSEEKNILTKQELDRGVRLLCRASFFSDGGIVLSGSWEDKIFTPGLSEAAVSLKEGDCKKADFDVAADIGTTTIALAFVDRESKKSAAVITKNNSQRVFGADVLSRIQAANGGDAEKLKALIWRDLVEGMDELSEKCAGAPAISRLVISANTTMQHLLAGDSCELLGVSPFRPVSLELRTKPAEEWWEEIPEKYAKTEVTLLPGMSAFVGADIVAGIYGCNLYHRGKKPVLFVDLGTNGEMALITDEGTLASSVAAGPALEGGNISCGVPSVEGAVNSVSCMGKRIVLHTIGNKRPIGLCGTGVLETAYEIVKTGAADEGGTFCGAYQESGFLLAETSARGTPIRFTQEDMRQLQMAKAAVRAGIELLKREGGLVSSAIDKVYLAGGFGCKLNVYKAAGIGLIPHELRERAQPVGNTSLLGATRYLADKEGADIMKKIAEGAKIVNLAAHSDFEEEYYSYMNFNR